MDLAWCADPRFWVDVAGVLVTALFSWLLYLASVRAAKANEGATAVSQSLYRERLRNLHYKRSLLLYKVVDRIWEWTTAIIGDKTPREKLMLLRFSPPTWDAHEIGEAVDDHRFAGLLLRILRQYRGLMDLARDLSPGLDASGNPIRFAGRDEETCRQPLEDFTQLMKLAFDEAEALLAKSPVLDL